MVSGRISLRYFSFLCMVLFQPGCTVELPEAFEQAASDESPGEGAENAGGESGEDSGAGEVPEDTAVSSEADGTEPVDALTGEKDGSEETDSGSGSDASAGNTACENDADCAGTAVENPCEQVACVSGTCTIGSKPINSPCEGDPLDPCNTYTCSVDGECVPSPGNDGAVCFGEEECSLGRCNGGVCEPGDALCDDQIGCTADYCWQVECPDDAGTGCLITEKGVGLDGSEMLFSGVLSCPFSSGSDGSCAGSCGEQSEGGCYCDDICFEQGDCCSDVCTECTAEHSAKCDEGFNCTVNLCPVGEEGDGSECLFREFPVAELKSLVTEEGESGFACARVEDTQFCDDTNSCTEDLCDPNAPAGETGCGFSSLVPGLKCSGKEFCADGNGGVCVPSSNEAGVICGDVNPANCLGGNACEKSACNPLTGQCEASLNFELGESASCDAQDPESGHFCGDGSCQPCPPGDPDCDVAHCVPSSPFGFQCTTDWDCASLDGNTWKCVGPIGDKHCILPCAGPPCQECMEKGNAVELRASVFKSCGQVCAGNQVFADSPSEMLQPDFLNAFWTSEDVGFLVADPDQAIAAIANAIDGLTLLKDVPMPEQPVGALFAEDMYSCSEKCALENAPLCYCDEACVKNGDCCPDACLECGAGSLEGETTPPFTCVAGAAGEDPFWATSQPVGKIGKDQGTFENCGTCIAEAVIAFANTNCSAVCNPCPTLPSTSIQASVCATVGGIDGTSAGVEEACVQPCTNFPQQGVFGCYEGVCGDYPGFSEIP